MKYFKKTGFILLLSLALCMTSFPQAAFAAGGNDVISNETLFAAYVDQVFGITGSGQSQLSLNDEVTLGISSSERRNRLTGTEVNLYDVLAKKIKAVAAGNTTSTEFVITFQEAGVTGPYTAKSLGLDRLIVDGSISEAALKAIAAKLDFDENIVLISLLSDLPYDLFWYDKTVGCSIQISGGNVVYDPAKETLSLANGTITFQMAVAEEFSATGETGTYQLNEVANIVHAAAANAKGIMADCSGYSDYNKLVAYKNRICDLVSYNEDAASDGSMPYGNPWQLIWVFDEDDTTNVVCEGYSKAFQYLCELTEWSDDTGSAIMTGSINGVGHMWNVVRLDGKNYLADITNSDEGQIGSDGQLFLAGTGNGDDTQYLFSVSNINIQYEYDKDTRDLYTSSERTLSKTDHGSFQFKDVKDSSLFYYDAVYWAAGEGIVSGWADSTFRPLNDCNRAAVVTFLWRMAGMPEPKSEAAFSDMTGNKEFNTAISWAAENGIVQGWDDNTFRPWNTCNRAAIVTFLWRYAGSSSVDTIADFQDMTGDTEFDQAISWAAENGITTGWDDGTFRPWDTCKRLAIVSFLYRYK